MDARQHQEHFTHRLSLFLSGMIFLLLLVMLLAGRQETSEIVIRIVGAFLVVAFLYWFLTRKARRRSVLRKQPFPAEWETILQREVPFYQSLDELEKARFREEVRIFLSEKRITGIQTSVDDTVRVLVAASAIIPIFGFPGWEWDQISEVLLYPTTFNDQYEIGRTGDEDILGMVGSGAMSRMMILSKPDLLQGFRKPQDRKNVGIHEFAHLLDKSDGAVDGVPSVGLSQSAVVPWMKLVHREMDKMRSHHSDINPYGLKSEAEFFAVASEYFFENPDKMRRKHPELYTMLEKVFRQDPQSRMKNALLTMVVPNSRGLGRNAPCPCGSGKKYKHCCLAN
ncbi:zinc-dependent peptidase [Candidatus Nitronereus thalassa]|uniref:Zinc-dependent peptidase n=1 Tax=Candidatus Nitronereus thalassa TaxID=3020898 RepID=A0ABU3K8R8_9BACT|nr:zinc-dependent peptidase [Candidatus Nitronereus thalassa]MDT7042767.1 zinc-dependent peptidase [Candidatus Nitronereus thalassa]